MVGCGFGIPYDCSRLYEFSYRNPQGLGKFRTVHAPIRQRWTAGMHQYLTVRELPFFAVHTSCRKELV